MVWSWQLRRSAGWLLGGSESLVLPLLEKWEQMALGTSPVQQAFATLLVRKASVGVLGAEVNMLHTTRVQLGEQTANSGRAETT